MIASCFNALKPGGYLAINIANVISFKDLVSVATTIIKQQGFTLQTTLEYIMSSFGKRAKKSEPIFIFKKGNFLK